MVYLQEEFDLLLFQDVWIGAEKQGALTEKEREHLAFIRCVLQQCWV